MVSVRVTTSGLVANRCDSSASERRSASCAREVSVWSMKKDSVAGPVAASTRTLVACTRRRRRDRVRSRNSVIGSIAPTGSASILAARWRARSSSPGS